MRYRPTPFHFVSLWFLYQMVIDIKINVRLGDQAELGGLFPFLDVGIFLVVLFIDFVFQFIYSVGIKGDWKMLYLTQILIIFLIAIFLLPTVHHAS